MSGEKLVDHNSISADFDEKLAEDPRAQETEACIEGAGAAEGTPRTAVYSPQVPSCLAGRDGDDSSTPAPPPGAPPGAPPSSKKTGKTGLMSFAKRATKVFRRVPDVDSSPDMVKEQSVPEGGRLTPRSAGRSIAGRKAEDRPNEDRFFVIDNLFSLDTPPPSPSLQPPVEVGAAGGGGSGGRAGADQAALAAGVSAVVGKVGLYGAFDGHGGDSCAKFVSRNLPQKIKNSPAWARLAGRDHEHVTTITTTTTTPNDGGLRREQQRHGYHREEAKGNATARPETRSAAAGKGARGGDDFDNLVVDVMTEALLYGFQSTQEAFIRETPADDDSGSTAIVAIVCGRHVVIANLGDSGGLYHNDQGALGGGSITAKTEFHTTGNKIEKERVEAAGGILTADGMRLCVFTADGRLCGGLQPTRSFGDRDVHRTKEGVLIAVPELTVHQVRPTANGVAFIVLGTDGLWDCVPDSKVVDMVRAEEGQRRSRHKPGKVPLRMAESLVKRAARTTYDDITAVVILFHQYQTTTPA